MAGGGGWDGTDCYSRPPAFPNRPPGRWSDWLVATIALTAANLIILAIIVLSSFVGILLLDPWRALASLLGTAVLLLGIVSIRALLDRREDRRTMAIYFAGALAVFYVIAIIHDCYLLATADMTKDYGPVDRAEALLSLGRDIILLIVSAVNGSAARRLEPERTRPADGDAIPVILSENVIREKDGWS